MGLVFLLSFRIGLNVVDSNVIDVGYAGVIGADRVVDGDQLYGEGFSRDVERGDTYGPLNYLAYVPFEQALPWSGRWDELPAAHGAAIAFDLLVVAGLLLLGPRLRPGREGRAFGLALAYAWAAYPYTAFALETNSDDALVALTCVAALLALTIRPARSRLAAAARGAAVAAGAAVKFAPIVLAPLFAVYPARGRSRAAVFALALAAVLVLSVIPFVPDGGLRGALRPDHRLPGVPPLAVQHLGPHVDGVVAYGGQGARGGHGARSRVRPARARTAADGRPRGGRADRAPVGGDVLVLSLCGLARPVRAGDLPRRLPEPRRAGAGVVRGARAGGRPRLRRLVGPALALLALGWAATLWVPPFSDDSVNDLYVYRTFARPVLDGELPYRDAFFEYPPLAAPVIALPGLLGTGDHAFRLAFAGWTLLLAGAVVVLCGALAARTGGRVRRALLASAAMPLLCGAMLRTHFDLAPMALLLVALLLVVEERPRLGLTVLGLAAMTKGFPIVAAAPVLAWLAVRHGRRVAVEGGLALVGTIAVISAIAIAISAEGFRDSIRYQVDRPVQVESTAAAFLYALDGIGLGEARPGRGPPLGRPGAPRRRRRGRLPGRSPAGAGDAVRPSGRRAARRPASRGPRVARRGGGVRVPGQGPVPAVPRLDGAARRACLRLAHACACPGGGARHRADPDRVSGPVRRAPWTATRCPSPSSACATRRCSPSSRSSPLR